MTTYSVNAQAVQDFLNRLSILSTKDKAVGMLQPQQLELAVAQFCAYEVYSLEALGLLDSYTCTSASVWASLEDDGLLSGSATISGTSGGSPLTFQTPRFSWSPVDANGNIMSSNYRAASGGAMVVVTHQNALSAINSTVAGYPGYLKLIQEVPSASPSVPSNPPISDDDNALV